MARKLDKLPEKEPRFGFKLPEKEKKPEEKNRILDAMKASMVAEREMREREERLRRFYLEPPRVSKSEMKGLTKIIDESAPVFRWSDTEPPPFWDVKVTGGSLKREDVEAAIDTISGPKEHRYRYPVRKPRRGMASFHPDTLPPPEASFTDQELRFTDGDTSVEVWEGAKLVCRIPVYALQAVLLNELLDAVS